MVTTQEDERMAYRLNSAARVADCSRDTLERLIARGELRSFKVGAARYISADELRRFIREREEAN